MNKLKELIQKFYKREIILYIIFGVLTTIINIASFMILSSIFNVEENFANIIGIILAVLFAYFTNRTLVFNSTASNAQEKLSEFGKFILGRVFTMIIESVGFWLLFTILNIVCFNGLVSKLIISVVVIILNFFISKFFAFKQ